MNARTWLLFAGVLVIWGLNFGLSGCDERGTFGDQFGVVNALFSGLAFAGLLRALTLQREQLEVQKEELRAQRAEMEETRKVFQMQLDASNRATRYAQVPALSIRLDKPMLLQPDFGPAGTGRCILQLELSATPISPHLALDVSVRIRVVSKCGKALYEEEHGFDYIREDPTFEPLHTGWGESEQSIIRWVQIIDSPLVLILQELMRSGEIQLGLVTTYKNVAGGIFQTRSLLSLSVTPRQKPRLSRWHSQVPVADDSMRRLLAKQLAEISGAEGDRSELINSTKSRRAEQNAELQRQLAHQLGKPPAIQLKEHWVGLSIHQADGVILDEAQAMEAALSNVRSS